MHACEDGHEFASMMAGKLYGAMMVMYNDMQHLIIRSFPSESSLVALLPTYCARMTPFETRQFFGRANYTFYMHSAQQSHSAATPPRRSCWTLSHEICPKFVKIQMYLDAI
jgi:hypothetical protein